MSGLENKVVIITGGSNGIGAATAKSFLDKGAKVASLDIVESASESETTTASTLISIKCNIASETEVSAAVKQVVDKWGTVNVLVNNAGVMDSMVPAAETSPETWQRCMSVNVSGPFYLIRACLPHMLANEGAEKGSIINVCSTASMRGGAAGAAYTASKHALLGLSRNTSWMYRHQGIRCNAVLPGGVKTNILQNSGVQPDTANTAPYAGCMPGMVEPTDVANTIVNLASSPGVNGAEVTVDLGWMTV